MLRTLLILTLGFLPLSGQTRFASAADDKFEVLLVKAIALDLEEQSDETYFLVDGQRRKGQPDGDGDYIRFGGGHPTEREINQTIFTDKPAGYSATFELLEQDQGINHPIDADERLGSCKLTVNAQGKLLIEPIAGTEVAPEPENNMLAVTFKNTPGCVYKLFFRKVRIEAP